MKTLKDKFIKTKSTSKRKSLKAEERFVYRHPESILVEKDGETVLDTTLSYAMENVLMNVRMSVSDYTLNFHKEHIADETLSEHLVYAAGTHRKDLEQLERLGFIRTKTNEERGLISVSLTGLGLWRYNIYNGKTDLLGITGRIIMLIFTLIMAVMYYLK